MKKQKKKTKTKEEEPKMLWLGSGMCQEEEGFV